MRQRVLPRMSGILCSLILLLAIALAPGFGRADSGRFLLVSDLHFNPFSDADVFKALGDQPVKNWNSIVQASRRQTLGEYGQDTDFALLTSSLEDARERLKDPDFILFPGDLLAHRWRHKYDDATAGASDPLDPEAYQAFIAKTVEYLGQEIQRCWPHTPVLTALGNNDSVCGDYMNTPQGPFLSLFTKTWVGLLGKTVESNAFPKTSTAGGYYMASVPHMPRHRLIVLNTVYFSNRYDNACGDVVQTPALDQLAWLQAALAEAQMAGYKVWLLMHIPPGIDNYASSCAPEIERRSSMSFWQPAVTSAFAKLIERYSSNIQIAFAGHTHKDDFRIIQIGGKPLLLTKIAPSISPIFGNNPAYQIYRYDRDTGVVENYRTYYLTNLTGAGKPTAAGAGKWELEYDFRQTYRLPDLTPASVIELARAVNEGPSRKQDFAEYYNVSAPPPVKANKIHAFTCAILNLAPGAYQSCCGEGSY